MRPPPADAAAERGRRPESPPRRHTDAAADRAEAAAHHARAAAWWLRPPPAVHQVLATLGYGDAIGHEVLGIQRVLRARRIRVGHLRRDGRPPARAADARLPRAGRRQRTRTTCCSTTSRSDRRRRARRSRCPIGWRSSTTTSRRPSTSSACTGRSRGSAFAAGGSCAPTSTAAISRSAIPSSTGRISKRSASRAPPSCRSCPDFSHLDGDAEPVRRRPVRRRLDEHPVCRPGDRQQEDRGPDPLLSRVPHQLQPALAPDHRRHVQPVRALPRRADAPGRGARTCPTCTSPATSRTRSWSRTTRSPTCSCAPASTKASACRSSRRSTSRCRSSPMPRRQCRHDGRRGRPVRRQGSAACGARSWTRSCRTPRCRTRSSTDSSPPCARLQAKDFAGTLLGFVERILHGPRAPAAAGRVGLLAAVRRGGSARRVRDVQAGGVQAPARRTMIVNQWLPAAHRGDAIGDGARRLRDLLRGMGHDAELYALTIDDGPRRRGAAVRPSGRRRRAT